MPDRDENEPLQGPDVLGIVLGLIVIAGLVLGFIVSACHSYDALTTPDDAGPAPAAGSATFQLRHQIHVPTTSQVCW